MSLLFCRMCMTTFASDKNSSYLIPFFFENDVRIDESPIECAILMAYRHHARGGNEVMPYVTVKMLLGRTVEQKRALIEKVTEAVSETTNAPKENITVFIEEMEKTDYGQAGVMFADK